MQSPISIMISMVENKREKKRGKSKHFYEFYSLYFRPKVMFNFMIEDYTFLDKNLRSIKAKWDFVWSILVWFGLVSH